MNFISVSLFDKVANHAISEGLSPELIPPIPAAVAQTTGPKVVPADLFFKLHEIVDEGLEPGFAVRVGQEMKMEDYGVLGLSWKTCSMARDLFDRCARYFKLLTNTYVFQVVDEDGLSKVHLFRDNYRRGVALSNEATFSATVKVLKMITEKDIVPVRISFKHDPPRDMSSHNAAFQCPVHFNQEVNSLWYKKVDLDTRTAKADKSINKFLFERVDEETKGIQVNANQLVGEVQGLIKDALPGGIPSKDKVGKYIGMSSRTLSRRLSEAGLSFRELIERTQQEISKELLTTTTHTISEIAFQTGFSEQSAFNRAFKRWTGQSPTTFRKY